MLGILRGDRKPLPPPVENLMQTLDAQERGAVGDFLAAAVIGGPDKVRAGLVQLQEATSADELMLVCDVFDGDKRLRSLDIAASAVA